MTTPNCKVCGQPLPGKGGDLITDVIKAQWDHYQEHIADRLEKSSFASSLAGMSIQAQQCQGLEAENEKLKAENKELKESFVWLDDSVSGQPRQVAYSWLRRREYIRLNQQDARVYVQITRENAGLVMDAFPDQVDGLWRRPAILFPNNSLVHDYKDGQWFRVDEEKLTPVTAEEARAE